MCVWIVSWPSGFVHSNDLKSRLAWRLGRPLGPVSAPTAVVELRVRILAQLLALLANQITFVNDVFLRLLRVYNEALGLCGERPLDDIEGARCQDWVDLVSVGLCVGLQLVERLSAI